MADRLRALPAWTISAALAIAYLLIDPPSADLAAQTYRAQLFAHHGLVIWDNAWYGGHHMPGYSVLFGPLGWLLGPRVAGAAAAVAAAWLFERLAPHHFTKAGARTGALWFSAATAIDLFTGRLTFALGVALAVAVVLAATHRRTGLATLAAVATTLASPIAGLFVGLGTAAWFLTSTRKREAVLIGGAALVPAAFLTVAFPEGGIEPFVSSSFWPALATIVIVGIALPRDQRMLRTAAGLYALATIASFALDTPMGGNVTRLGGLVAGPVLACALWPRQARLLAVLAIPLLFWQWGPPHRDWTRAASDPSVHASYYDGVTAFLKARRANEPPFRIEVPFTANHWESRWLGEHFLLARGWERQLDIKDNDVFYKGTLTATRYRAWLDENAIHYVALPDVALDASAKPEAALIKAGLPFLHQVYGDTHWRVFEVGQPAAMADGALLTQMDTDSFTLQAARPGTVHVRIRFSPYFQIKSGDGCVGPDGDWTTVQVRRAGETRVGISFALGRIHADSPRCTARTD